MNPHLSLLQPYPFQKLSALLAPLRAPEHLRPINLSIGEPKHPTPAFISRALADALGGLSSYPATAGGEPLRRAIAQWLTKRYGLPALDPATQVLPVLGSREALFSFCQAVVDPSRPGASVVMPNPFYQIYEGAALLAGARPEFLNLSPRDEGRLPLEQITRQAWDQVQLLYVCSPSNPTGAVLDLEGWREVFAAADRHGFVIAADECYSEIYLDETSPPLGALQAAHLLGRADFSRLMVFGSLSKRSNVPGMRSGYVAGETALIKAFLHYRTYHGCAMSPAVQAASIAAWDDEDHVRENRRLYRDKYAAVGAILRPAMPVEIPPASFYLWLATPGDELEFTRRLYADYNVLVIPGCFLARPVRGNNPGSERVRMALVAPQDECIEAAARVRDCVARLRA